MKCFDLEIKKKNGSQNFVFVGIDKSEQELLMNYFKSKAVKVMIVDDKMANKFDDDYDDEDDLVEVRVKIYFYTNFIKRAKEISLLRGIQKARFMTIISMMMKKMMKALKQMRKKNLQTVKVTMMKKTKISKIKKRKKQKNNH